MTKKNLIALADAIREHNRVMGNRIGFGDPKAQLFNQEQLDTLADALAKTNPAFKRERWLGYIAGTNGSNGGPKEQQ